MINIHQTILSVKKRKKIFALNVIAGLEYSKLVDRKSNDIQANMLLMYSFFNYPVTGK